MEKNSDFWDGFFQKKKPDKTAHYYFSNKTHRVFGWVFSDIS